MNLNNNFVYLNYKNKNYNFNILNKTVNIKNNINIKNE